MLLTESEYSLTEEWRCFNHSQWTQYVYIYGQLNVIVADLWNYYSFTQSTPSRSLGELLQFKSSKTNATTFHRHDYWLLVLIWWSTGEQAEK